MMMMVMMMLRFQYGIWALLGAFLALTSEAGANTEIANFGPILCRSDTAGRLISQAAEQLSGAWPTLALSSGTQAFALPPSHSISSLSGVSSAAEDAAQRSGSGAWIVLDVRGDDAEQELDEKGEIKAKPRNPRDRFLAGVWNSIVWPLRRRYTLRMSWPANFPADMRIDVLSPTEMLALGNVSWRATSPESSHTVSSDETATINDEIPVAYSDPRPCARLYAHITAVGTGVLVPKQEADANRFSGGWQIWLVRLADFALGALGPSAPALSTQTTAPAQPEHPESTTPEGVVISSSDPSSALTGQGDSSPPPPIPIHLTLERLHLFVVPHTALGLLGLLMPIIAIAWIVVRPRFAKMVSSVVNSGQCEPAERAKVE